MEEKDPLNELQWDIQRIVILGKQAQQKIEKINIARKEGRKPNESWQDWSFRAISWKDQS